MTTIVGALRIGVVLGLLTWLPAATTVGCADRTRGGDDTSGSSSGGPPPASSRAPVAPAPAPGSRPPVRDDTVVGPAVDGVVLELRSLVGRVTTKDGIGLAVRTRSATPPSAGDRGPQESVDWSRVVPTLHFEVKTPTGAVHVLEPAPAAPGSPAVWRLGALVQTMTVDGTALAQGALRRSWRTPVPGLLATPGRHTVSARGTFTTDGRTRTLESGPIAIDVVAPSDAHRPLVDLERAASEITRATWGVTGIPVPSDPTVDDAEGAVSVRFRRSAVGARDATGYDDDVLEVWLDRSGKALAVDTYRHFTCIAAGTLVATPGGAVPVEQLVVGSEVLSHDVAAGAPAIATVLQVTRGHADSVRVIGGLRATAEHPVWADGRWTPAGDVAGGASLLGLDGRITIAAPRVADTPTTVIDLAVTAPHTYFAGGVLVHNKAVHVPLGGERPWGALFFRRAARP